MPEPDDIISPIGHTRMGGQRGQVREFCANCEQFGHSADKCENEEVETFQKIHRVSDTKRYCITNNGAILDTREQQVKKNPIKWIQVEAKHFFVYAKARIQNW